MNRQGLDPKKCQEWVSTKDGWGTYQCTRPPKVERDGKMYCTIHDPEYIAKKREAEKAKWDALYAAREESRRLEGAKSRALEGLILEECQALTPNLARAAPKMYEALKTMREQVANLIHPRVKILSAKDQLTLMDAALDKAAGKDA